MAVHLTIPDPHASPEYPNDRFDWLGRFIMDLRPDVIVCLGDFADMPSLSSYDKGKKSFEGRRFADDAAATVDAQSRLFGPLEEYNERARRNKDKQYKPRRVLLGGNHDEGRISRVVNDNPEWTDVIDLKALRYDDFWTEYIPYKQPVEIDGVMYCHHFPTGISGRPISGITMARQLLQKNYKSSTVGHSHLFDVHTSVSADGRRMWGMSAGVFHEHVPEFAYDSCKMWWRGVVVKRNVKDGDYDFEQVSLSRLRDMYS